MPVPFPVVLKGVRYSTAFPPMTSDTTPAGYIVRSPTTTSPFAPLYQAFDGVVGTWTGGSHQFGDPQFALEIEFPTLRKPVAYSLRARQDGAQMPATWRLTASDDGITRTILDTRPNQPAFAAGELRSYPIATPVARKMFRYEVYAAIVGSLSTLSELSFDFVTE